MVQNIILFSQDVMLFDREPSYYYYYYVTNFVICLIDLIVLRYCKYNRLKHKYLLICKQNQNKRQLITFIYNHHHPRHNVTDSRLHYELQTACCSFQGNQRTCTHTNKQLIKPPHIDHITHQYIDHITHQYIVSLDALNYQTVTLFA